MDDIRTAISQGLGGAHLGSARYDEIADWYDNWIGDSPGVICAEGMVAEDLSGLRVLDAACGPGRLSRELARRGADVVGVDLSARLVAKARERGSPGPGRVAYVVADVCQPAQWWDGSPFDGVVCELALQDIDDLSTAAAAMAAVVRAGGWLRMSMVHPCFPGSETGLPSWPPDRGYSAEGRWTSARHNPNGARLRVGSSHRRLSTYLNAFLASGFMLERAAEPAGDLPVFLVLAWRRARDATTG